MADPYADFSTPVTPQSGADPYAAFSTPAGAKPASEPGFARRAGEWLLTRGIKSATGLATLPSTIGDLGTSATSNALSMMTGRPPAPALPGFAPRQADVNNLIFSKAGVPERGLPGPLGKVIDVGVEGAIPAMLAPSTAARNFLPMFTGSAAQEAAGQATAGTKLEPFARLVAGIGVGGLTGATQNAVGNVAQGVRNIAPNVPETAAKIIARGMERDSTTGNALSQAHSDLGPGALAVEAAGPNLTGTMRGSIAAPGPARTTAQNAFDARLEGSNARTTTALDKALGPQDSLGATTDELNALRAQASRPAYQASGVPARIKEIPGVQPDLAADLNSPKGMSIRDLWKMDNPPPPKKAFNTPNIESDRINALLRDSKDVQAAIGAARRLPDFKDLPSNSMAMLDKAYKHLGGMEQEAIRSGNGTRAYDIGNVRKDFESAITEANPAYKNALDAYSGPSKLIGAGTRGNEWFSKNVDPIVAGREYQAMSPPEQQAAMVGIRDWARNVIGRTDRGMAAERVWSSGNNRERLQAILPPHDFEAVANSLGIEKNAIKKIRDVSGGSRTTPMGLEAADNANGASINTIADLGRGRFMSAAGRAVGNAIDRIGEGRTEAVNAHIAKLLTSTDPRDVGLVAALADRARIANAAKGANRLNALKLGVLSPLSRALAGDSQ